MDEEKTTAAVETEPGKPVEVKAEQTPAEAEPGKPVEVKAEQTPAEAEPEKPAEAEEPDELTKAQQKAAALGGKLKEAMCRAEAIAAGVAPGRVAYAMRMADIGGIDAEADDAQTQIAEAIKRVLKDVPELAAQAAGGTGSAMDHPRVTQRETDPFARGLKQG